MSDTQLLRPTDTDILEDIQGRGVGNQDGTQRARSIETGEYISLDIGFLGNTFHSQVDAICCSLDIGGGLYPVDRRINVGCSEDARLDHHFEI